MKTLPETSRKDAADSVRAGVPVDSLPADSLPAPPRFPARPSPVPPAGAPEARTRLTPRDLETLSVPEGREAVRRGLEIEVLDGGAPHRADPFHTGVPGRDVPELRFEGVPVGPIRWPETSFAPVPLLAIDRATLRRYSPILAPLAPTGGPLVDLTLAPVPVDHALTSFRLTQGSYGTYTDEIVMRRPFGPVLFTGFYGDSKSDGRWLWGRGNGQTVGVRIGHPLAGGWGEWGVDEALHRSRLLATKRGLWDRTAWTVRWARPDSLGTSVETILAWSWIRLRWETSLGATERLGRSIWWHGRLDRPFGNARVSAVLETDLARVHTARPGEARRLLEEGSVGAAVGWERVGARHSERISVGVTRLAPLAAAPVFSWESQWDRSGLPVLLVHASRAVRNRTLPRLPADGEAWVRQGCDLAAEEHGEEPEGLWRAGIELRKREGSGRTTLSAGVDLLLATRAFAGTVDDLALIGTVDGGGVPEEEQRGTRRFWTPWLRFGARLRYGLRLSGSVWGGLPEGKPEEHLGLAAVRWRGEAGWYGEIFKRDLRLDLTLRTHGQSRVATPYGLVAPVGIVDAEASGGIGSADLFLVLANLMNVEQASLTYDGGFMPLPLRHFRAGIRWSFLD